MRDAELVDPTVEIENSYQSEAAFADELVAVAESRESSGDEFADDQLRGRAEGACRLRFSAALPGGWRMRSSPQF